MVDNFIFTRMTCLFDVVYRVINCFIERLSLCKGRLSVRCEIFFRKRVSPLQICFVCSLSQKSAVVQGCRFCVCVLSCRKIAIVRHTDMIHWQVMPVELLNEVQTTIDWFVSRIGKSEHVTVKIRRYQHALSNPTHQKLLYIKTSRMVVIGFVQVQLPAAKMLDSIYFIFQLIG